jgi:hypothetical protein
MASARRAAWAESAGRLTQTVVVVPIMAALCQAATIAVTWKLWEARDVPPNIPVVHVLVGIDFAVPLLATAVACVVVPRVATPLFLAMLTAAVLGDQTRIQPEVVSLALLMALPLLGANGIRVSRWHLTALWLWSGLNKVLSTGWSGGAAAFIASSLHVSGARPLVAIALPAAEITLALTSLRPRAWRVTRWGAVALHLGVFVTLSPLFAGWNSAVWPWNIALAGAGFLLFRPDDVPQARPAPYVFAAAAVLVVTPALFYAGFSDAYLSHNLYTSNTARAQVCATTCTDPTADAYAALNVPLPPEKRLYRAVFNATCSPDMRLTVTGPATVFSDPPRRTTYACPRRAF